MLLSPHTLVPAMYDYIFKDALIYDGSGSTPFRANVATLGSRIAFIGKERVRARNYMDCSRLVLAPGFIDIHAHSELLALRDPMMSAKTGQGITTDLSGNCGIGVFPVRDSYDELKGLSDDVLGRYEGWTWNDFPSFKEELGKQGIGINMAFLQAHAPLRYAAMGHDAAREATEDEIAYMCNLLDESLSAGCKGFSSGLYYAPCLFASEKELLALLKVVKEHDAFFAVHHRCEGNDIIESVREVISLAERTGVRLEISHLKVIGKKNSGKLDTVLELIASARSRGVDVLFDQYPYNYGSTSLFSLLPPSALRLSRTELRFALALDSEREEFRREMLSPRGWDSIYEMAGPDEITILELEHNKKMEGLTLAEAGKRLGTDPLSALFDLLEDEPGAAVMMDITEDEKSLEKILTSPLMCFGTDALYSSPNPHPRSMSGAVHLIRRYGLEKKTLPLESLIQRMSGEGARRLGLKDRGLVREAYAADLVLMDLDRLKDTAEPGRPFSENEGIVMTMVNGVCASADGRKTGSTSGIIL